MHHSRGQISNEEFEMLHGSSRRSKASRTALTKSCYFKTDAQMKELDEAREVDIF
jgi:hypothetical protein